MRAARNRRLIAQRLGDPAGVVDVAELLEARHPGWCVSWRPDNTTPGFERAAGYYACRVEHRRRHLGHGLELYGATPEAIAERLAEEDGQ